MNDLTRADAHARLNTIAERLARISDQLEAEQNEAALDGLCALREELNALFAMLLVNHLHEQLPQGEDPFDWAARQRLSVEAHVMLRRFFKVL